MGWQGPTKREGKGKKTHRGMGRTVKTRQKKLNPYGTSAPKGDARVNDVECADEDVRQHEEHEQGAGRARGGREATACMGRARGEGSCGRRDQQRQWKDSVSALLAPRRREAS
jgi:hypothetical protein